MLHSVLCPDFSIPPWMWYWDHSYRSFRKKKKTLKKKRSNHMDDKGKKLEFSLHGRKTLNASTQWDNVPHPLLTRPHPRSRHTSRLQHLKRNLGFTPNIQCTLSGARKKMKSSTIECCTSDLRLTLHHKLSITGLTSIYIIKTPHALPWTVKYSVMPTKVSRNSRRLNLK